MPLQSGRLRPIADQPIVCRPRTLVSFMASHSLRLWGSGMSSAAALNSFRADGVRAVAPIFFLSPLVTSAVPRLTWLFFFLVALSLILPFLRRGGDWRQLIRPSAALIGLLLVVLYAAASAVWAADPCAALGEASLLLVVVMTALAAATASAALDRQQLRRTALAFAAGAFLGALFLLIELLTDGVITRTAMNWITLLQPDRAKHLVISEGRVTKINLSLLNRNVAMLMFHFWPGLLILWASYEGTRRAILIGVFLLAIAAPVTISEHDSSQIALIGSLLVFPLAWAWRGATIRALAVLWCLAFVVVLPVDFLAFKADLHMATWLPGSFRARVILWEYTAERVLRNPWLGIGAASTPALSERRAVAQRPAGFIFPRTTGQHAHDLFLQTWYELGILGVMLVAFAGAAAVLRIPLLPFESQPFAVATFTTLFAIAAFAWGIWQEWLMCAVGLLVIYSRVAANLIGSDNDHVEANGPHQTAKRATAQLGKFADLHTDA
jgi:O-antigen ligase